MFLQNVKCLRYGTLRYVTLGWKTRITLLERANANASCPSVWLSVYL